MDADESTAERGLCRQDFLRRARAEETRAEQRFRSTQRLLSGGGPSPWPLVVDGGRCARRHLRSYRRDIRFAENRAQELKSGGDG
eukprot:Skav223735  [mRNA]  locus=scaffold2572:99734:101760:+ [translate_table: standard]